MKLIMEITASSNNTVEFTLDHEGGKEAPLHVQQFAWEVRALLSREIPKLAQELGAVVVSSGDGRPKNS